MAGPPWRQEPTNWACVWSSGTGRRALMMPRRTAEPHTMAQQQCSMGQTQRERPVNAVYGCTADHLSSSQLHTNVEMSCKTESIF